MPQHIAVPTLPPCTDCIKWSPDLVIAVALEAHVELLVPTFTPRVNVLQWNTISLDTCEYSEEDIPRHALKSWHDFSIGEELSERETAAIAWSPRPIGKYRSSVLAVLNVDHVLSIWQCSARPQSASASWTRALFLNPYLAEPSANIDTTGDVRIRAWRIRAFCFAPENRHGGGSHSQNSQLMAVTKDNGHVVIIALKSPYHKGADSDAWQLDILHSVQVPCDKLVNGLQNCFPSGHVSRPPYADQMDWSPWVQQQGQQVSKLAIGCAARLFGLTIAVSAKNTDANVTVEDIHNLLPDEHNVKLTGLVRWCPWLIVEHSISLLVFGKYAIQCFDIGTSTDDLATSSLRLDLQWDNLSGVSFHHSMSNEFSVSFVLHSRTTQQQRLTFSLPFRQQESITSPWHTDLIEREEDKNRMRGQSGRYSTRVFGIDTASEIDMVVTASAHRPLDMLEYAVDSRKLTMLLISHASALPGGDVVSEEIFLTALRGMSSKAILIRILHDVSGEVPDSFQNWLIKWCASSDEPVTDSSKAGRPSNAQLTGARLLEYRLFETDRQLRRRCNILLRISSGEDIRNMPPDVTAIRTLITEMQSLPPNSSFKVDAASKIISALCERILMELRNREPGQQVMDPALDAVHESCHVCNGRIDLESIRWARCDNGHSYSRCGVSFRALQAEDQVKTCSLCGVSYFAAVHDTKEAPQATMMDVDLSETDTLASMLHQACESCYYCGGRLTS